MITLFAICPKDEGEFSLLARPLRPGGAPLAFLAIDRAAESSGRVLVCTDSPRVRAFFAASGREVFPLPAAGPDDARTGVELAPEQVRALVWVVSQGLAAPEDIVVLADWRAPLLLGRSCLLAAETSARRDGGLAASLLSARDHPAQGHVPYVLLGMGQWVFPDPDFFLPARWRGLGATRPFLFDWSDLPDSGDGLAASLRPSATGRLTLSPVGRSARAGGKNAAEIFLWTGAEEARLLLPPGGMSRAAPIPPGRVPPLTFVRTARGGVRCRWRRVALPVGALLQIWPVSGPSMGRAVTLEPDGARGGEALLPAADFDARTDGVRALALALSPDGRYDVALPMTPSDGSWRWEPATGVCVENRCGQRITGRQQLPPVSRVDGLLVSGRAELLLDPSAWNGPVAEIPLDERERMRVGDVVDRLRIEAILGEE